MLRLLFEYTAETYQNARDKENEGYSKVVREIFKMALVSGVLSV